MTNTLPQPLVEALAPESIPFRAIALPRRGTTYACDLAGPAPDSPAVVLLHGLMATGSLNWAPFLDDLATQYRVVALDHRGHGRGIVDGTPFTLEQCADDVAALLDTLGIDQAIVVGYSMGGPIAQLTWQRHPHRVRGLVLCATASTFGLTPIGRLLLPFVDNAGKALSLVPPPMRSLLTQPALGLVVPAGEQRANVAGALRSHHLPSIRGAIRAILGYSSAAWLNQVSVPTSVVLTERDHVVSPARQEQLLAALPDADVIRIDADHLACFTDPEIFGAALVEAVASVVNRSPPPRPPTADRLRDRWRRSRSSRRTFRGFRAGRVST